MDRRKRLHKERVQFPQVLGLRHECGCRDGMNEKRFCTLVAATFKAGVHVNLSEILVSLKRG